MNFPKRTASAFIISLGGKNLNLIERKKEAVCFLKIDTAPIPDSSTDMVWNMLMLISNEKQFKPHNAGKRI